MKGLRFVLVRPRSPGNVGAVARAMKNFGFGDLVLVDPRLSRDHDKPGCEPYFEAEARRMAWHASDLLDRAVIAATLEEAVADRTMVIATAPGARARMECLSPEEGAVKLAANRERGTALVFGSESSGLNLAELARCSGVIVIPTDEAYRDLNLAQSAVLLAYLVYRAAESPHPPAKPEGASHEELERLVSTMEEVALAAGFLQNRGEPVSRELRAMVHRLAFSGRETGLLKSLALRIRARLSTRDER